MPARQLQRNIRNDLIFGGPRYNSGWVDEKVPLTVVLSTAGGKVQADNEAIFSGDAPSFTHLRLTRTADFNNDGYLDIAIANHGYDAGGLSGEYNGLLLNSRAGGFIVDTSAPAFNYRGFTHAMAVGDIDNDGDVDIVYVDITGDDVNYRTPVRILYNDGAGSFRHESPAFSHDYATQQELSWTAAALADLDGDGYLDLIVGAMNSRGRNMVFYNDGRGALKLK